MIRNIVFDMGNVLLEYDPSRPLNQFFDNVEDQEIVQKELFEGPEWVEGDYGHIKNADRYDLVKGRIPERLHKQLKLCVEHWFEFLIPIPGAKEFVEKSKNEGYGIYVLSNASDDFYRYFPKFLPIDYFDGVVVSSDIKMIKPDIKIYEYLLNTYDLKPEECLFIDDRDENVEGAKKALMNGVKFDGDFSVVEEMLEP